MESTRDYNIKLTFATNFEQEFETTKGVNDRSFVAVWCNCGVGFVDVTDDEEMLCDTLHEWQLWDSE